MGNAFGNFRTEQRKITVRQILHHLGHFPSDAALESKILAFFASSRMMLIMTAVGRAAGVTVRAGGGGAHPILRAAATGCA
jgi:hypothetical protein